MTNPSPKHLALLIFLKNRLAEITVQLGGTHQHDLTQLCSHLLVAATDTPKYQFVAKERDDIKVLTPAWLDAVNEQWKKGGEVDVTVFEDEYRAPTFLGLRICLTGFDDLNVRTHIAELVKHHGADYSGDLTRDITHLIAAAPSGKKYEYAKEWQLKVVGIEWLHQSIERGLALGDAYFSLHIAPEERGRDAWRRERVQSVIGKRQRQDESEQVPQEVARRKLRRAVSEKFGSQSGAMWADIISGVSEKNQMEDDWNDIGSRTSQTGIERSDDLTRNARPTKETLTSTKSSNRHTLGIFAGSLVHMHGFDASKTAILNKHLSSNGARTSTTQEELESFSEDDICDGFLVTPHDTLEEQLLPLPDVRMQRVTEWWIEVCLHQRTLVDPSQSLLCEPFFDGPIEGLQGVVVCSSGFQPIQILHLSKLLPLLGANYDEFLKPATSILLAGSDFPKVEKLNFAIEHKIPVARPTWLQACLKTKFVQKLESHLLPASASSFKNIRGAVDIRRYSESSSSKLQDDVVRAPPQTKPRKTQAQAPAKSTEFRRPRALIDTSEKSPDLEAAPTRESEMRAITIETALQELPSGSTGQNRLSPSMKPSRSKSASQSPMKENDIPALDGAASAEILELPEPETGLVEAEPKSSEHLHNAITALLAQKQASRPSSARDAASSANDQTEPRRRRRGILGRASSATSNPPGSALSNLSRASSVSRLTQPEQQTPGPATQALQQPAPSQALVYEDATVQQEREEMIRRMGGKVLQSMVREGSGVIRDIGGEQGGVTGRLRRRAREARGAASEEGW